MKSFKIPVTWETWALAEVEANTLEEAKQKVMGHEYPLPTDGSYVDDSFKIDEESIFFHNEKE